jgi:predicted dithiol-disulfide oxidoreductase (DUF899 family)
LRTASTAALSTSRTTTSLFQAGVERAVRQAARLQAAHGLDFPWASSFGSDFNADFHVSVSEQQRREGVEYNYRREAPVTDTPSRATPDGAAKGAAMTGTDLATYVRERPGMSAFVLEGEAVYHSYSAYARGLDGLWGAYQWLDRAPKGRNEPRYWWHHHDEYATRARARSAQSAESVTA